MLRACGLLLAAVLAVPALAAEPGAAKAAERVERFNVWADQIVYHGKTGKFSFTGKVTVIKGDLRVDCDEMEGLVDAETRRVSKVIAMGHVQMVSVGEIEIPAGGRRPKTTPTAPDAWRATSAKADYDLKAGRIVLSGKQGDARPRLWRAKGYGEADEIVFIPDKGEYELIGAPVIRGDIPVGPIKPQPRPDEATTPPSEAR